MVIPTNHNYSQVFISAFFSHTRSFSIFLLSLITISRTSRYIFLFTLLSQYSSFNPFLSELKYTSNNIKIESIYISAKYTWFLNKIAPLLLKASKKCLNFIPKDGSDEGSEHRVWRDWSLQLPESVWQKEWGQSSNTGRELETAGERRELKAFIHWLTQAYTGF